MTKKFTASLEIRFWKEHQCCICKTIYRYLLRRQVQGQGKTQSGATENATNAALNAIKNQVELRPCPTCGLYQPDMIGMWRYHWHNVIAAVSLLLVFPIVFVSIKADVSQDTIHWIAAGLGVLTLFVHVVVANVPFNDNCENNRVKSQSLIPIGDLIVSSAGNRQTDDVSQTGQRDLLFRQGGALRIFLMMGLAIMIMRAGEVVRLLDPAHRPSGVIGWVAGMIGVLLLFLAGGMLCVRAVNLAGRALPTRVFPLAEETPMKSDSLPEPIIHAVSHGPISVENAETPEGLLAEFPVKIASTIPFFNLNILQLQQKIARTRCWFYSFVVLIPSSLFCAYLLGKMGADKSNNAVVNSLFLIMGCFLPLVGVIGTTLMLPRGSQLKQMLRYKLRELEEEPRLARNKNDGGEIKEGPGRLT